MSDFRDKMLNFAGEMCDMDGKYASGASGMMDFMWNPSSDQFLTLFFEENAFQRSYTREVTFPKFFIAHEIHPSVIVSLILGVFELEVGRTHL